MKLTAYIEKYHPVITKDFEVFNAGWDYMMQSGNILVNRRVINSHQTGIRFKVDSVFDTFATLIAIDMDYAVNIYKHVSTQANWWELLEVEKRKL